MNKYQILNKKFGGYINVNYLCNVHKFVNNNLRLNSMISEKELFLDAVKNLKTLTRRDDITIKSSDNRPEICIGEVQLSGEVISYLNNANFNQMLLRIQDIRSISRKPLLLIVGSVSPQNLVKLADEGVNVLDYAGNCYINIPPLYIFISGQKQIKPKETIKKVFNDSALKLIFYFLLDKSNIGKSYRKIGEETGYSIGTVKNVIEAMTLQHHIIKTAKGRVLMDWRKLLDDWQVAFNQSLKPKLFIKKMTLASTERIKNWKNTKLPQNACWGGESGANLTDGYLIPEILTIYTDGDSNEIIRTSKILPSSEGEILVYKKFWPGYDDNQIAPKILIYADLMGTANSRCLEAAQRILNHEE